MFVVYAVQASFSSKKNIKNYTFFFKIKHHLKCNIITYEFILENLSCMQ